MGYRIDIGCGHRKQPGCIGLDYENFGQEITRDLTKGLPFSDNTVSEIYLNHSLEHFRAGEELWFLITEMYRVLHDGGIIHVRVPHSSSNEAHNPSHVSWWNEHALMCFDRDKWPGPAVPSRYWWNFEITHFERSPGIEFQFHLKAKKALYPINPESAKLAIITVCFNQLHHTKKLLNSLRRFGANPIQIIAVNNASTDGTREWLASQHDITIVNLEENMGWVGVINEGIKHIDDGINFVIFANNDTIVDGPGWDTRLLSHFKDELVGAVGPTSNYVMGRQNKVFNHGNFNEEETNTLIGFFMCLRRNVIEEAGELDDLHSFTKDDAVLSGGDDHDYSIRIRQLGYRLVIARDVFVFHAGSQSLKAALTDREYFKLCDDADEALKAKWGEEEVGKIFQSPIKICHCIPARSEYWHEDFSLSLSTLIKPFKWEGAKASRAHITIARNKFVEYARSIGASHLFMTDNDHELPPDTFMRLYNMNAPVAAALAFQRNRPFSPCIYQWVIDPESGKMGVLPLGVDFVRAGVRQVEATGMGAVLIEMSVFDELEEPYFEWHDLGEDLDFCLKCHNKGIPIYIDTDLILPHIGDQVKITETRYLESLTTTAK